jgi:Spy/CpxP family protein refolding chaperone
MRRMALMLGLVCVIVVPAFGQKAAPATAVQTPEEMLKDFRTGMQSSKADLLAKSLSLTAEEASKFWPVYDKYQKEQNGILDDQLKAIHQYVNNFDKLDDPTAVALMNANFDRDARMNATRKKWLSEFQKALPAKLAVRAMQIDRMLSLAQQLELAAHLPLAH